MEKEDLELNLITALKLQQHHDECLDLSLNILKLPSSSQGGVTILLLSFIDWTSSMRKYINSFGYQLVKSKELILPHKKSLLDEVSCHHRQQ